MEAADSRATRGHRPDYAGDGSDFSVYAGELGLPGFGGLGLDPVFLGAAGAKARWLDEGRLKWVSGRGPATPEAWVGAS